MGACGCGDYAAFARFPGPDGITYAVEIYPSCPDCRTPIGVTIYRHDESDPHWWRDLPEIEFHPMFGSFSFQVVTPERLRKVVAEHLSGVTVELDDEDATEIVTDDIVGDLRSIAEPDPKIGGA